MNEEQPKKSGGCESGGCCSFLTFPMTRNLIYGLANGLAQRRTGGRNFAGPSTQLSHRILSGGRRPPVRWSRCWLASVDGDYIFFTNQKVPKPATATMNNPTPILVTQSIVILRRAKSLILRTLCETGTPFSTKPNCAEQPSDAKFVVG